MICNVPNEVIESVRMGTWCGSSIVEKMVANGIPLEQIKAEIKDDWQLKKYPSSPFSCGLKRTIEIIDKCIEESEEI